MLKAKKEDIASKQILQKYIDENLDDFLSTNIKLFKKKKQLLNAFKQKQNMGN